MKSSVGITSLPDLHSKYELYLFYFAKKLSTQPKNLTFLYSCFAVLPPPAKLELTLAGKAKAKQSEREGTYFLSDGLENGYPHWLKLDESQAIWFNKETSSWLVGSKEDLGTDNGWILGPGGKDSYPNKIKQGWRYSAPGWQDAGPNDVIFKAIG